MNPSNLTNESSKLIIKIDSREHDLFLNCKSMLEKNPSFKEIKLVSESLPLGDVIIQDNESEKIIIERKTLNDLASSIKDGRYTEQSYRLNGISHHNHNIIYLIEGDMTRYNMFKGRMDKTTLYSAMFSINYYKGFSTMRSNSIEETAFIIANMVYKMLKSDKLPYYSKPVEETNEKGENKDETNIEEQEEDATSKDYCKVVKKVKKDNINASNIGEIMLCQVPGISSVTALAILDKFKTLPRLILSLHEDENCLKDLSYVSSSGQTRKISKSCITTIIEYFKV
jgi:crossover junction endonuclease MUS81